MPKLSFSGKLANTIRNDILNIPVIAPGAFSIFQDGVQDGRQYVKKAISFITHNTSHIDLHVI